MSPIRGNWKYIVFASALFIIGMTVGAVTVPVGGGSGNNAIIDELEPLFQYYKPYQPFTVIFLFLKNLMTAGLAFVLAPIILAPPVGILLLNGYVLGMVGALISNQISAAAAFVALAPHGVFEIPALIMAAAAGFRFGLAALRKIASRLNHRVYDASKEFTASFNLFLLSVILLFVAAIMETYATPLLMGVSP